MAGRLSDVFEPRVLLLIGCHWVTAISLIFVNKQLLTSQHGDPDLTIFIAWAQCLFSVIAVFVTVLIKRSLNPRAPLLSIPLATFVHADIVYMTLTFIGILITNNYLLKNIGVDFYQVARSSTLIFTVIFTRVLLGVKISPRVVFSCTLIMVGFMVSVDQEMVITHLSWITVSYGLFASMAAALNGIFIKRADKQVRGNALNLSLVNNINTVLLLLPLLLSTGQLQSAIGSSSVVKATAWYLLILTGVLRLLVGWTAVKVISLTSPVTHHMSINAKSLLQTLIAVLIQEDSKTLAWWVGNFLVMLGIVNYGFTKSQKSDSRTFSAPVKKSFVISRNSGILPM